MSRTFIDEDIMSMFGLVYTLEQHGVIEPLNDTQFNFWALKHVVYISSVINRIKKNLELVILFN